MVFESVQSEGTFPADLSQWRLPGDDGLQAFFAGDPFQPAAVMLCKCFEQKAMDIWNVMHFYFHQVFGEESIEFFGIDVLFCGPDLYALC